ncbi:MAG: hypothetical protein WBM69_11990, partial [Desulfobacterales bacterium]
MSKETQIQWGAGAKIGTFYPTRDIEGKQLRLFGVASNGKIEIVFQSYPLDRNARSQLIQELNSIGQISIP